MYGPVSEFDVTDEDKYYVYAEVWQFVLPLTTETVLFGVWTWHELLSHLDLT